MSIAQFFSLSLMVLLYEWIERNWVTPRHFFFYYLAASVLLCATVLI